MKYTTLGSTDLKVSRLCIGCMSFGGPDAEGYEWSLGYEDSKRVIDRAIDLGINFFDTADVYSNGKSEQIVGRALHGRRSQVVLATKVGLPTGEGPDDTGLGRKHITRNLKRSLANLKTDRVDLYQIHRWDYKTPIERVLRTLTDAVRKQNAVDHLGGSSMWAWQFAKALFTSDRLGLERFETMQDHYNLAYREEEREMIPLCREEGIPIIPWSPLGRGFLTGKYKRKAKPGSIRYKTDDLLGKRYFRPEDFDVVERLEEVAKEKGAKPAQVALAWLLHKKDVSSPIIGPTKVEQLEELAEAVDIRLKPDEVKRLEEPYRPHRVLGHE
ncbi:MAG TPA: aldo/keto reductase [Nitrososphaerales archaeon]|nr:aldo/keto reductase [Nitrososphaerales archaeon]